MRPSYRHPLQRDEVSLSSLPRGRSWDRRLVLKFDGQTGGGQHALKKGMPRHALTSLGELLLLTDPITFSTLSLFSAFQVYSAMSILLCEFSLLVVSFRGLADFSTLPKILFC